METKTVNTEVKQSKWFKGSCLIETESQVLCRIFQQDFNSDEEANQTAELIVTVVNACKAINPDNPLFAAEKIVEMFEELKRLYEKTGYKYTHDLIKAATQ